MTFAPGDQKRVLCPLLPRPHHPVRVSRLPDARRRRRRRRQVHGRAEAGQGEGAGSHHRQPGANPIKLFFFDYIIYNLPTS
jgi:hypothetical protein